MNSLNNDMESFNQVVSRAQGFFPSFNVKYKDESLLMKLLSYLLFFNKRFNLFTTTIGSTVYFPSRNFVQASPASSIVLIMHELSHIFNSSKKNSFVFSILYLLPQILALSAIPVFFLFGLLKSLACLLFLLPLPAYFRMTEEKQAYTISLYVLDKLIKFNDAQVSLDEKKEYFLSEFGGSSYYFMWCLPGLESYFNEVVEKLKAGQIPNSDYPSDLYEMVDKVLEG